MSVGATIDPTEPFWGSYAACNLGGAAQCRPDHWDGFTGYAYIGPHNRITDTTNIIEADFRSVAASSSFTMTIAAYDDGSGRCTSPGTVANLTVSTTTAWNPYVSPAINFSGKAGCTLSVQFGSGSTTDQVRVGLFNVIPLPGFVLGPGTAPTEGGSCPAASSWLGAFSGYTYFCDGGVVKRVAIS